MQAIQPVPERSFFGPQKFVGWRVVNITRYHTATAWTRGQVGDRTFGTENEAWDAAIVPQEQGTVT